MTTKRRRLWENSILYEYVRGRELERSMAAGPSQGVYLLTAHRIRTGWGYLSKARWPYDTKKWPPHVPAGHDDFDRIASYNRSSGFFAIRNLVDAKLMIASGAPFQLTVPLTQHWHKCQAGVIPLPLSVHQNTFIGIHAILICGYDDNTKHFLFQNSWGVRWGDNGYGYLPYSYMSLYMFEAWAGLGYIDVRPHLSPSTYGVYEFRSYNSLGNRSSRFVIFGHSGEKIGWCFTIAREGFLDVEDFFVKPTYHPVAHCLALACALRSERDRTGLPLRFWLSHCDASATSYNHVVATNVMAGLGLRPRPSPERWAASVAT